MTDSWSKLWLFIKVIIFSVDTVAPMITCPANIMLPYEIGTATGRIVTWAAPTVTDVSGAPITVNLLSNKPPGSFFQVGANEVMYRATDLSGATSNCQFTVTINTGKF